MFTILAKLLKVLNSDQSPAHLALAVCFGLAIGLMPGFSAFLVILICLLCIFKANLSLFFLTWGLFEGVAYIFDPVLHQLGYGILTQESLNEFWSSLMASSFWKLTAFNNSLVMGALVTILALWLPVYLLVIFAVTRYRSNIQTAVEKFKLMQMLKGSKFYKVYQSVAGE